MTVADTVRRLPSAPSGHLAASPLGTRAPIRPAAGAAAGRSDISWGHDDTGPAHRAPDARPLREARRAAARPLPAHVRPALRHLSTVRARAAVPGGRCRAR